MIGETPMQRSSIRWSLLTIITSLTLVGCGNSRLDHPIQTPTVQGADSHLSSGVTPTDSGDMLTRTAVTNHLSGSPSPPFTGHFEAVRYQPDQHTLTLALSATLHGENAPHGLMWFLLPPGMVTTAPLTYPIAFVANVPVQLTIDVDVLHPGQYTIGSATTSGPLEDYHWGMSGALFLTITDDAMFITEPTPIPLCPPGPIPADDGIHPTWTNCQYNP